MWPTLRNPVSFIVNNRTICISIHDNAPIHRALATQKKLA